MFVSIPPLLCFSNTVALVSNLGLTDTGKPLFVWQPPEKAFRRFRARTGVMATTGLFRRPPIPTPLIKPVDETATRTSPRVIGRTPTPASLSAPRKSFMEAFNDVHRTTVDGIKKLAQREKEIADEKGNDEAKVSPTRKNEGKAEKSGGDEVKVQTKSRDEIKVEEREMRKKRDDKETTSSSLDGEVKEKKTRRRAGSTKEKPKSEPVLKDNSKPVLKSRDTESIKPEKSAKKDEVVKQRTSPKGAEEKQRDATSSSGSAVAEVEKLSIASVPKLSLAGLQRTPPGTSSSLPSAVTPPSSGAFTPPPSLKIQRPIIIPREVPRISPFAEPAPMTIPLTAPSKPSITASSPLAQQDRLFSSFEPPPSRISNLSMISRKRRTTGQYVLPPLTPFDDLPGSLDDGVEGLCLFNALASLLNIENSEDLEFQLHRHPILASASPVFKDFIICLKTKTVNELLQHKLFEKASKAYLVEFAKAVASKAFFGPYSHDDYLHDSDFIDFSIVNAPLSTASKGFHYVDPLVEVQEEERLLKFIDSSNWDMDTEGRRVQVYGSFCSSVIFIFLFPNLFPVF